MYHNWSHLKVASGFVYHEGFGFEWELHVQC
jgi:hypothetical protein